MKSLFVLFGILSAVPAFAAAADERRKHNVQCLVAASFASEAVEGQQKVALTMAALFFSGQVFGSDPDIDLLSAAKSEAAAMTSEKVSALLVECGAEMARRGKQLSDVGKALMNEAARLAPGKS